MGNTEYPDTEHRSTGGSSTEHRSANGRGTNGRNPDSHSTNGPRAHHVDTRHERAVKNARYQALAERAAAMALEDAVAAATSAPELARQRLARAREARRRAAEQDALVEQLTEFAT